jgi:two-component system sensor histidine kinase UhpB
MSLRSRLVLCLAGVLAVTLGLGCALAGWRAAASVRTELQSALAVGRQAIANGLAGGAASDAELRRLVASFDGNRHVRATLTAARGAVIAASQLQDPARPIPSWFARAIDPELAPVVLAVSLGSADDAAITLRADARNEIGEVRDQAVDAALMLAVFFGLTVLLIHWVVGRALRPLARLGAAFSQIGAGDYAARLDGTGAPELARLATGFNRMAAQLGAAAAENRHLHAQLLSLQEEERAELARDLHDEVGPFLFAASVDVASMPALLASGRSHEADARLAAVAEALAHIQRHIRAILFRLRAPGVGAVGLNDAIGTLVAFWRRRHPGIAFALEVTADDDTLTEAVRATACRVVQEGLCNAVRHGCPAHVEVSVTRDGDAIVVRIIDDGVGAGDGGVVPGHGLLGMRERVRAQAGTLAIAGRAGGTGLAVTARLPCAVAA